MNVSRDIHFIQTSTSSLPSNESSYFGRSFLYQLVKMAAERPAPAEPEFFPGSMPKNAGWFHVAFGSMEIIPEWRDKEVPPGSFSALVSAYPEALFRSPSLGPWQSPMQNVKRIPLQKSRGNPRSKAIFAISFSHSDKRIVLHPYRGQISFPPWTGEPKSWDVENTGDEKHAIFEFTSVTNALRDYLSVERNKEPRPQFFVCFNTFEFPKGFSRTNLPTQPEWYLWHLEVPEDVFPYGQQADEDHGLDSNDPNHQGKASIGANSNSQQAQPPSWNKATPSKPDSKPAQGPTVGGKSEQSAQPVQPVKGTSIGGKHEQQAAGPVISGHNPSPAPVTGVNAPAHGPVTGVNPPVHGPVTGVSPTAHRPNTSGPSTVPHLPQPSWNRTNPSVPHPE